jgi:hypothetical protein
MWTPHDVRMLVATTTGCMSLVILVLGTIIGVLTEKVNADILGKMASLGAGGGLVAFLFIVYLVIRAGLQGGDHHRDRR